MEMGKYNLLTNYEKLYMFCDNYLTLPFLKFSDEIWNEREKNRKNYSLLNEMYFNNTKSTSDIDYKKAESFNNYDLPYKIKRKIKKILTNPNNCPEELFEDVQKLYQYMDNQYLLTLAENLPSLTIENLPKMENITTLQDYSVGYYQTNKNKIYLREGCPKSTQQHELLHAARALKVNKKMFLGFARTHKLGFALNGFDEGYTDLLTARIYEHESINEISYLTAAQTTALIELLFDDYKDMEKASFINCIDLVYLQFRKYGTKKEFYRICRYLDFSTEAYLNKYERKQLFNLIYDIVKRKEELNPIEYERILDNDKTFFKKI